MKRTPQLVFPVPWVFLLAGVAGCFGTDPQELAAGLGTKPARELAAGDARTSPSSFVSPVCVSPWRAREYLIANYRKVFLFRKENGELRELRPEGLDAQGSDIAGRIGRWNPTGVFYSSFHDRVFIANYSANNILILQLDPESLTVTLDEILHTPETVSPENVVVSTDGRHLVSANYDAGNVTAFVFKNETWTPLWTAALPRAHGVAIIGRRVYASSLARRQVVELDLEGGRHLRSCGKLSWDAAEDGFLWPTCLYPRSATELLVSDAHTGRISVLDLNSFTTKSYFGANGPGHANLNMPYGLAVDDEFLILLSTFQNRILFLERDSWSLDSHFVPSPAPAWEPSTRSLPRLGSGWKRYSWREGPVLRLFGADYLLGYGKLEPLRRHDTAPTLTLNMGSGLRNLSGQFYFLQSLRLPEGYLVFSPQNNLAFYLCDDPGSPYLGAVSLGVDCWEVDGELRSGGRSLALEDLLREARQKAAALVARRLPSGGLALADFVDVWTEKPAGDDTSAALRSHFRSEAGLRFVGNYLRAAGEVSRAGIVESAAADYYRDLDGAVIALDELFLVQMLSGRAYRHID